MHAYIPVSPENPYIHKTYTHTNIYTYIHTYIHTYRYLYQVPYEKGANYWTKRVHAMRMAYPKHAINVHPSPTRPYVHIYIHTYMHACIHTCRQTDRQTCTYEKGVRYLTRRVKAMRATHPKQGKTTVIHAREPIHTVLCVLLYARVHTYTR